MPLTSHQLDHVGVGLLKDESDVLLVTLLELLLQEAAAVLILAKTVDLTGEILQLDVGEASIV